MLPCVAIPSKNNAGQMCECNFGHGRVASALHCCHTLEHAGWHGAAVPLVDFLIHGFAL